VNDNGDGFSLEGVPPYAAGAVLGDYLTRIEAAFLEASDHDRLFGYYITLTAVMQTLDHLPGFDCDQRILKDLTERLVKLSVGQKQLMMALVNSVKVPHRAPDSILDEALQARTIGVVDWLVSRGWADLDAHKMASTCLAKAGVTGRQGGPISPRAIADWRWKVKQTHPSYRVAIDTLDRYAPDEVKGSKRLQVQLARMIFTGSNIIPSNG
jgi:hypothetical protein